MMTRVKKSNAQFDQVLRIEQEFASVASVPFRIVERFEKKILPGYDFNFSGILHINEFNLDKTPPNRPTKPHAPKVDLATPVRSQSFLASPTAPPANSRPHSASSASIVSLVNEAPLAGDPDSLQKWIAASHTKPQSESTITNSPNMSAAYSNLLFTMDPTSYLSVYERAFTAELKNKNSLKLGVPNARAIAVNSQYFAVAYSGLTKKEQSKGLFKNLQPSGIVLYRRENYVVCTVHDKVIELKEANQSFKSPSGLAMTDTHLFVCDKELKSVLKFDLKTGALVNRAKLTEGEPNALTIKGNKLFVSDCVLSHIYVFDTETFSQLKSASIKQLDQIGGQFMMAVTDDELLFVKNSDSQVALLDQNLKPRAFFNELAARVLSVASLVGSQGSGLMLVIGCVNSKQQYKLYGYVV